MGNINFQTLVGSITSLFNTSLSDPYNGTRVGSFVFSSDQDIYFTKYMPKIQITEDSEDISNISFGVPYQRDEIFRVNAHFFTKKGDQGAGTSLKDRALVWHYLKLMKNLLVANQNTFGGCVLTFDTMERPIYLEDQQIYVGTLPVIIQARNTNNT